MLWFLFFLFIGIALALDLGVFHNKASKPSPRAATGWSILWISLSLLFSILIWHAYEGNWEGVQDAKAKAFSGYEAVVLYLSGYLLELSLSLDNIFVIAVIFGYFRVPGEFQHRVLFWGILGALVFRAIMIFAGVALIQQFTWLMYVFGAFIIYLALKMWMQKNGDGIDLRHNRLLKWIRKVMPVSRHFHGQSFFVRRKHIWIATPLFLTLIMVELTDVLFALDSIPAIFSITTDPFLIFTSNIFAIMGLRSMYFMLASVLDRFRYLKYSIIAILLFVGLKMVSHGYIHLAAWVSLVVIGGALLAGVVFSFLYSEEKPAGTDGSKDIPAV